MDRTKTGLYIHIPFCRGKCPYCDFYSVSSPECADDYVDALCDEIKTLRRMEDIVSVKKKTAVDTVYFGGGTPSLLSSRQLNKILESVYDSFSVDKKSEITLECNPSSPGIEKLLRDAFSLGVNRISLGMQSSSDSERKKLGRRGGTKEVRAAVEFARKAGFENISLDVMIGVPDSNVSSLKNSLDLALECNAEHLSAYMLKIEEGTYYHKNADKFHFPDEDETADMYLFMSEYLSEKGYLHYEISNFCKDGYYSKHNMKYWDGTSYLGFGPAAHSFFDKKRFYFPRDINGFINGEKAVFDGFGGDAEEKIMLSLRTYKGIDLADKNSDFIKKTELFEKYGYAKTVNGVFSLTPKGFLISNTIISELLSVY